MSTNGITTKTGLGTHIIAILAGAGLFSCMIATYGVIVVEEAIGKAIFMGFGAIPATHFIGFLVS